MHRQDPRAVPGAVGEVSAPRSSRSAISPRSTAWARSRCTRCGRSTCSWTRASSSCCSGRPAPASRRCSTSSAGSTCRRAAQVLYRDIDLTRADEADADRVPPPPRRLRLPVLQSDSEPDGASRTSRSSPRSPSAPMTPDEALRLVNLGAAARSLSRAALRRRAAARGDRARDRQAAVGAALRRADRRARHLDRHRRARGAGRVNAELGTTTVVITHNAAIAAMADRVIRLADGRVIARRGPDRAKLAPHELSW